MRAFFIESELFVCRRDNIYWHCVFIIKFCVLSILEIINQIYLVNKHLSTFSVVVNWINAHQRIFSISVFFIWLQFSSRYTVKHMECKWKCCEPEYINLLVVLYILSFSFSSCTDLMLLSYFIDRTFKIPKLPSIKFLIKLMLLKFVNPSR